MEATREESAVRVRVVSDEDDPPEPIQCRPCGTVDAPHDDCPYATCEVMSEADESTLLAMLKAQPLDFWRAIKEPMFSTDEYEIDGWKIGVFFDGAGWESWDYIEYATTPAGVRYECWPDAGKRALPARIAYWSPDWPRPSFVQMLGKLLGEL